MRLGDGPDVGKPGDAFYSGEGGGGVAAVGAQAEADRFMVFGERRGIDDEVDLRLRLVAGPGADLIVEGIDSGAALGGTVGANEFAEEEAGLGGGVRGGGAGVGGGFF